MGVVEEAWMEAVRMAALKVGSKAAAWGATLAGMWVGAGMDKGERVAATEVADLVAVMAAGVGHRGRHSRDD